MVKMLKTPGRQGPPTHDGDSSWGRKALQLEVQLALEEGTALLRVQDAR